MSVRRIVQAEILSSGVDKGALGEPSKTVIDFDESLCELVADLQDTMWAYPFCVGLAAPQIGVNLRVAVINPTRESRDDDLVLVNPTVLSMAGKKDRKYESCMSVWGYQGTVERRSKVGRASIRHDRRRSRGSCV